MADEEFTIRFLRDAQIERAHPKDSPAGGFWLERIPAGTIKRVKRRSVEFWRGRGLDLIEIIDEPKRRGSVEPLPAAPAAAAVSPSSPVPLDPPTWTDGRKALLRRAIDAVLSGAGDFADVQALQPDTVPGMTAELAEALNGPFRTLDDVRALRALVRGRPGRRRPDAP